MNREVEYHGLPDTNPQATQGMPPEQSNLPPQNYPVVSIVDGEDANALQPPGTFSTENHEVPDFNTEIKNYEGTIDNHDANHIIHEALLPPNGGFQNVSATFTLRVQSLSILENLVSLSLAFAGKLLIAIRLSKY